MARKPSFSTEIANLLYAMEGSPINSCIQCGLCSGTCPVEKFMDYSPREIIELIRAGFRNEVLSSNTIWYCSSCYHCTARCPCNINITDMMYALKRYSLWKNLFPKDMIGPDFSRRFLKAVMAGGRSYEPGLAPSYIFKGGFTGFLNELQTGLNLLVKGRLPLTPAKIDRIENFRRMIKKIIPVGEAS